MAGVNDYRAAVVIVVMVMGWGLRACDDLGVGHDFVVLGRRRMVVEVIIEVNGLGRRRDCKDFFGFGLFVNGAAVLGLRRWWIVNGSRFCADDVCC